MGRGSGAEGQAATGIATARRGRGSKAFRLLSAPDLVARRRRLLAADVPVEGLCQQAKLFPAEALEGPDAQRRATVRDQARFDAGSFADELRAAAGADEIELVVLLDRSGSTMRQPENVGDPQAYAAQLAISSGLPATVLGYDSRLFEFASLPGVAPSTADEALGALDGVVGGPTMTGEMLNRVAGTTRRVEGIKTVCVVMTDGMATDRERCVEEIRQLRDQGCPVAAIGLLGAGEVALRDFDGQGVEDYEGSDPRLVREIILRQVAAERDAANAAE